MPKFEAEITIKSYGTITVDAETEDEVREIIETMGLSSLDCDTRELEIDDIREIEGEEKMPDEQRDDGVSGHLFGVKK